MTPLWYEIGLVPPPPLDGMPVDEWRATPDFQEAQDLLIAAFASGRYREVGLDVLDYRRTAAGVEVLAEERE